MGGSLFLALFFGLFLAVGLAILGYGGYSLSMSRQAEHWPTAPGTVTASDFVVSSDDDGTTYRAKISYSYNALGRELAGDKIAFGYSGSSSERFHREIYEALPVGAQVAVRYDPQKPERAALSFGVNQSIRFLLIFGAVWTIFTLGMVAMFWMAGEGADSLLANMIIYSRE